MLAKEISYKILAAEIKKNKGKCLGEGFSTPKPKGSKDAQPKPKPKAKAGAKGKAKGKAKATSSAKQKRGEEVAPEQLEDEP